MSSAYSHAYDGEDFDDARYGDGADPVPLSPPAASLAPANDPLPCPTARGNPNWPLRPDADFINAVLTGTLVYPRSDYVFEEDARRIIHRAFKEGLRAARAHARHRAMTADLSGTAQRLWLAIDAKTFAFGKLLEKIPHRFFVRGQPDAEREGLLLNGHGLPVLPPIVGDKSKLSKPLKALLRADLISRITSTPHSVYGPASIYSPLAVHEVLQVILDTARADLAPRRPSARACELLEQIEARIRGFENLYRDAQASFDAAHGAVGVEGER